MNSNLPNSQPLSAPDVPAQENSAPSSSWLRWFRYLVAILVLVAIFYTVNSSANQISAQDFKLAEIELGKICLAICSYIGALTFSCTFWKLALKALNCDANWTKTLFAFFASQLGKYVPGKAMVVVVRTDLIRGQKADAIPAAASVFVETLTWIFVGSVIACVLIVINFHDQVALQWTAILLAVAAGTLTAPPVFRALAAKLTKSNPSVFKNLGFSTIATGWGLMTAGWCLNALSLYLVIGGLPDTNICWADFPLTLACVTLATVAGFVSLLPGGLGVRELVMIPLLGPRFGVPTAIIAAILIRLVWIFAELFSSGIIYLLLRFRSTESIE